MNIFRKNRNSLIILLLGIFFSNQLSAKEVDLSLTRENWKVLYDGYGTVEFSNVLKLHPKYAADEKNTHAALVISKKTLPSYGIEVELDVELVKQNRPQANPWESFWIFYQYKPSTDLKKATNYFLFKTNGWEVGKAWNISNQEFIYTREAPSLKLGRITNIKLRLLKKEIELFWDGKKIETIPNKKLFSHAGNLGLYTEDAEVIVYSVVYRKFKN